MNGYVLMQAESADLAEDKVGEMNMGDLDAISIEASDDVTDSPRFAARIKRGNYNQ